MRTTLDSDGGMDNIFSWKDNRFAEDNRNQYIDKILARKRAVWSGDKKNWNRIHEKASGILIIFGTIGNKTVLSFF